MQLSKGNDVADEDLDAGGNEPVVELNNGTSKNNNQTTIGTSSDSNSSSASENEVKDVRPCSSFSGPKVQSLTSDIQLILTSLRDSTVSEHRPLHLTTMLLWVQQMKCQNKNMGMMTRRNARMKTISL